MSLSHSTDPSPTSNPSTISSKISLPIHQIIHSLQISHGGGVMNSPHQDHSGYLKYLSNKLHKTRKNLNFLYTPSTSSSSPHPNPKNTSSAAAAASSSFEFHEITLEMCQQNSQYFHLLIYSLEKYFTKSLLAKNSYLTLTSSSGGGAGGGGSNSATTATAGGGSGSGGNTSTKQLHLFKNEIKNKFKAIKTCQQLCSYVTQLCDDITILEVTTFSHYLMTTLMFTKEQWKECYESSMEAMRGYQELLMVNRNPYDTTGSREIYQLYVQNLEPLIRFCCYNLGISFHIPPLDRQQSDQTATAGVSAGARGVGEEGKEDLKLFSNDTEMLSKYETLRMKTLSQEAAATGGGGGGEVSRCSVTGDPIYDLFNSIIWCNHQIALPYHHSSPATTGPPLSSQDQAMVTSLHSSCGKLILFLELQSALLPSSSSSSTPSSSQLKSLYLPTPLTSQAITHYLSLVQDIISITTRLLNSLPSSLLNSSTFGNRLSRDSLFYFRQYFTYLQYFAQYQHSVFILTTGGMKSSSQRGEERGQQRGGSRKDGFGQQGKRKGEGYGQQKGSGQGQGSQGYGEKKQEGEEGNEMKLHQSQEKVHLCDQILKNLKEMMKIVEGTVSSSLPSIAPASGTGTETETVMEVSEDCYEDILLLSLKSFESIYRTFRLVYLAETYGYYGLVLSASQNVSASITASASGSLAAEEKKDGEDRKEEGELDVLTPNLEKAYGLLEFADEVMSNDGKPTSHPPPLPLYPSS
jgi:hypothetical protein